MKKYKLFLISPKIKYHHYGVQKELANLLGKKYYNFSTALPLIAALTPDNYEIKIIDESVDDLPDEKPDIIGLTTFTFTKKRCYEIADHYRSMNVPVIIGGAHATYCSDEVLEHADSVVIGEAELVWKNCLKDFENNNLKKIYKSERLCDFKTSPVSKWNLLNKKDISIIGLQATRGCPFKCEFCIVGDMLGTKQRKRDVNDVINEIKSLPVQRVFFVDDNLTWDKKYLQKLLNEFKKLEISWITNASIEIGDDPVLLKEMADSGCLSLFIGFETLNPESLKETKKYQNNVLDYDKKIKNIHDAGIQIIASFVVGFDYDNLDIYDRIYQFTYDNNLLFANIYFLLPVPGSKLADKIKNEKRLLDIDPDFLNANFPSFKYKNFKCIDMYDKFYNTIKKMFSFEVMSKKVLALLESGSFKRLSAKEVKFFERIKGAIILLKRLYFVKDLIKKEFFKKIFLLGKNKTASWDNIAYLALAILGFDDYIKYYNNVYKEVRDTIAGFDR